LFAFHSNNTPAADYIVPSLGRKIPIHLQPPLSLANSFEVTVAMNRSPTAA